MSDNIRLYNPTYDDIHDACKGLSKQITLYDMKLDAIVGVSRGGLIPATILSQMLDVPLIPISYSSKVGKGDDKNHQNTIPELPEDIKTILILDDIVDSGHTLDELAVTFTMGQDKIVYTGAIYYKQLDDPRIIPNLFWLTIPEDAPFVNFPWERNLT